jgi:hypothetical protein
MGGARDLTRYYVVRKGRCWKYPEVQLTNYVTVDEDVANTFRSFTTGDVGIVACLGFEAVRDHYGLGPNDELPKCVVSIMSGPGQRDPKRVRKGLFSEKLRVYEKEYSTWIRSGKRGQRAGALRAVMFGVDQKVHSLGDFAMPPVVVRLSPWEQIPFVDPKTAALNTSVIWCHPITAIQEKLLAEQNAGVIATRVDAKGPAVHVPAPRQAESTPVAREVGKPGKIAPTIPTPVDSCVPPKLTAEDKAIQPTLELTQKLNLLAQREPQLITVDLVGPVEGASTCPASTSESVQEVLEPPVRGAELVPPSVKARATRAVGAASARSKKGPAKVTLVQAGPSGASDPGSEEA